MCRWCAYADLVTTRFEGHLTTVHQRSINVEECFRPCMVFVSLIECDFRGCNFRTHTEEKMAQHRPVHEEDDSPASITLETTVRVGDLSEDVQKMLIKDQRRRMGDHSRLNKVCERERGLSPPPLELNVTLERQKNKGKTRGTPSSGDLNAKQPRTSKRKITGFGRGRTRLEVLELEDTDPENDGSVGVESRRSKLSAEQPVSSRTRRRMKNGDAVDLQGDERRERTRRAQEELFSALRNLPRKPQPMMLPLERAARQQPRARYIAQMFGGHYMFFMSFFELLPAFNGQLIHRRDDEKISVVMGAIVNFHLGAPETHRAPEAMSERWNVKGPIYDVGTRPWSIVRKMQLSSTPDVDLYHLLNPATQNRYNTQVFRI